jgi:hypothetical protein
LEVATAIVDRKTPGAEPRDPPRRCDRTHWLYIAVYLTMALLFIGGALGDPLSLSEQIGLLVFMIVASKGPAGVTGAGLATLAGGLPSHRPDLLDGVGRRPSTKTE